MAKRKRLTVPAPDLDQAPIDKADPMYIPPVEDIEIGITPTRALRQAGLVRAPIADVAGQAAATSALEKVAGELTAAKQEGRMIVTLPLDVVQPNHLVRDRMVLDAEDLDTLKTSLRARGQQTPIEVTELGDGKYGLISGYRRLQALKDLRGEAPDAAPNTVLALIRHPEDASDAYIAMVEENEVRANLSYYERASIVRSAVREGVFPTDTAALQGLFASASRSKRSKIKSFLPVIDHLEMALMFPVAITERMGLALAARCSSDPDFTERLKDRLRKARPETAEEEQALLSKALDRDDFLSTPQDDAPQTPLAPDLKPAAAKPQGAPPWAATPRSDVSMTLKDGQLVLTGAGVTQEVAERIAAILQDG